MIQLIRSRRFLLFFAIFLLSVHQATISAYYDFEREAVMANRDRFSGAHIPNALVISYITQLGLGKICTKIADRLASFFFVRSNDQGMVFPQTLEVNTAICRI